MIEAITWIILAVLGSLALTAVIGAVIKFYDAYKEKQRQKAEKGVEEKVTLMQEAEPRSPDDLEFDEYLRIQEESHKRHFRQQFIAAELERKKKIREIAMVTAAARGHTTKDLVALDIEQATKIYELYKKADVPPWSPPNS